MSATSATFSVTLNAAGVEWKPRELLATTERVEAENPVRNMDIVKFT